MRFLKWLYPGMSLKRWLLLFAIGVLISSIGLTLVFNYKYIGVVEEEIFKLFYRATGKYYHAVTVFSGVLIVFLGIASMVFATRQIIHSVISVLLPEKSDKLVDIIYQKRKLGRGPNLVVIGGGTGLSVMLRGLKDYTSNITAIVTVADDGGSSGRLRGELGIIPPGDLRNCLVALAATEPLMEKLFQHRFRGTGELAGHSFGNIFIAAMSEILGDFELALKESSKVLAVRGQVLPATLETVQLVAELTDGTTVVGESRIPKADKPIRRIYLEPTNAEPVKDALTAIQDADAVILGPGSLYTSILPNLMVKGIADALRQSEAVKLYICNVMTQYGETKGYTASQHLRVLQQHIGSDIIDYVMVNVEDIPESLLLNYAREDAHPVVADIAELEQMGVTVVQEKLISQTNLVRHDPVKLAHAIMRLLVRLRTNSERMKIIDYYLLGEKIKEMK